MAPAQFWLGEFGLELYSLLALLHLFTCTLHLCWSYGSILDWEGWDLRLENEMGSGRREKMKKKWWLPCKVREMIPELKKRGAGIFFKWRWLEGKRAKRKLKIRDMKERANSWRKTDISSQGRERWTCEHCLEKTSVVNHKQNRKENRVKELSLERKNRRSPRMWKYRIERLKSEGKWRI